MPHLTLEYSRNLSNFNPMRALLALNTAMFDSGLFSEPDIKSRAIALETFLVGISPTPRGFAHVRIALLAGRSDEERKELADAVLASLGATIDRHNRAEIQLSVETTELDRASYAKAVING
ncbi:5-carboxymethyl-2-hydroxymuconate Delta-isomerase [Azonexus sp. IMCC34842]|uniref:5-carboxymethyl-2-hydroxymuconate Delta-isomerase n=1 Tax=Azonexus sp. IMCC34842 TaxID=3420950 RepID=UPI003D14C913